MSPQAALLIGEIVHARKEWEGLRETGLDLKEYHSGSRDDFINKCDAGEYDGVAVIYRSNESTVLTGPFDANLVEHLPKSLKFICHNGAGYDNIDVSACTARGIGVSSTPIAVNHATADMAIFLMIGALRRIHPLLSSVRRGDWRGADARLGHDTENKTLGIIGMGGIGKEVAKRAHVFRMHVIYHDLHKLPDSQAKNTDECTGCYDDMEFVSLDELLARADIISLHLSLTEATHHLINACTIAKMKDGVVIVNTARGGLIDTEALVDALRSGKIGAAGLDVFENEPVVEDELRAADNVILTPHLGTVTWETQRKMELLVLKNLRSAVKDGVLVTQVREQLQASKL